MSAISVIIIIIIEKLYCQLITQIIWTKGEDQFIEYNTVQLIWMKCTHTVYKHNTHSHRDRERERLQTAVLSLCSAFNM